MNNTNNTIPQVLYANADETTFMQDANTASWAESVVMSIAGVAYLSSFPTPCIEDGDDESTQKSFPLTGDGLKFVEEYLNGYVKPFVTKWDKTSPGCPIIAKAEINGETLLGVHARKKLDHRFFIAGTVLGQVLAQECGLKWITNSKGGLPGLGKPTDKAISITPWAKVRKFACYGEEDNLAGFVQTIKHIERTNKMCAEVKKTLEEAGKLKRKAKYVEQLWTRPDGTPHALVFKDMKGKIMARSVFGCAQT